MGAPLRWPTRAPRSCAWVALVLCAPASVPAAQDVQLLQQPSRWRLSAEHVHLVGEQEMGLAGVHFDLLGPIRALPALYVGAGGYGAVTGDRGGLFVGGVTGGLRHALGRRFALDVGLFAGGGGGGGGREARGLMLRPHAALETNLGLSALRVELAHVSFVDGDIESTHVSLGLSLPSELLTARRARLAGSIPADAYSGRRYRFTPTAMRIRPDGDSRRRDGAPFASDVDLLGVELDYFLDDWLFLPVEAYGAAGGEVDGFAMGFLGLGVSLPVLGERLRLEAKGLGGAGGGGDVDTGGGLLWQAMGRVSARVASCLALELSGGLTGAPDGRFGGETLAVGLSWSSEAVELDRAYPRSRLDREGLSSDDVRVEGTRLEILHKSYEPSTGSRKKNGSAYDTFLHLVGVGVEQELAGGFSLTGRAFGAWDGNVGGYGEGLFGVQYELTPFRQARAHHFFGGAEVGAGGGGGADVGSGLIYHLSGGYRVDLTDAFRVTASIGRLEAIEGSLEATSFTVGLQWNLRRAFLR